MLDFSSLYHLKLKIQGQKIQNEIMGKDQNNVNVKMNVLRNILTQVDLKAMWQMYLKTELPFIRLEVVWGKKCGHIMRKRMSLKIKRKAKMGPTQNPSLESQ